MSVHEFATILGDCQMRLFWPHREHDHVACLEFATCWCEFMRLRPTT